MKETFRERIKKELKAMIERQKQLDSTENQIIFGANYFPAICGTEFKTPRRNEYEQFIKEHPTNWIIWDKVNSTTGFNDCELIWVSFPVPTKFFTLCGLE